MIADLSKYSVLELYNSGSRFVDDYDEAAAVDHFLQLHPSADRAKVVAELKSGLEAVGAQKRHVVRRHAAD